MPASHYSHLIASFGHVEVFARGVKPHALTANLHDTDVAQKRSWADKDRKGNVSVGRTMVPGRLISAISCRLVRMASHCLGPVDLSCMVLPRYCRFRRASHLHTQPTSLSLFSPRGALFDGPRDKLPVAGQIGPWVSWLSIYPAAFLLELPLGVSFCLSPISSLSARPIPHVLSLDAPAAAPS